MGSGILNSIISFFADMDGFSVPFGQIVLFVTINSFCLLFARYKLGLLTSYCFVLYWGFISNREYFIDRFGDTSWGLIIYAIAGVLMIIIFLISLTQGLRD